MDSLRLPPLNFNALPNQNSGQLYCELPPISLHPNISPVMSCNRQYIQQQNQVVSATSNNQTTQLLPVLPPLFTEATNIIPNRISPIASFHRQSSSSSKASLSPTSSTSSTPSVSQSQIQSPPSSTRSPSDVSSLLNPITVPSEESVFLQPHSHSHSHSHPHPHPHPHPQLQSISEPQPQHYQQYIPEKYQQHQDPQQQSIHILPSNVPIAPIKRSIQTPKGIREVYTCPFPSCNRISSEHSNMKAHMRLHTGERPYVCRVASCRKSFRWKSSLTYHERALHSNSRPYQCIPCRKSFVEKRKLRLHHQLCPAVRAAHTQVLQYGKVKVPIQTKNL